jgi:hypothetical protein
MSLIFPIFSKAQKMTREKAKEVCEIYGKVAIPYLKKAEWKTDDEVMTTRLAVAKKQVMKLELIQYTEQLKSSYFDDLLLLTNELDRFVGTMYDTTILTNEYFDKVHKKLEEVVK